MIRILRLLSFDQTPHKLDVLSLDINVVCIDYMFHQHYRGIFMLPFIVGSKLRNMNVVCFVT
jgi:hypothetical protein